MRASKGDGSLSKQWYILQVSCPEVARKASLIHVCPHSPHAQEPTIPTPNVFPNKPGERHDPLYPFLFLDLELFVLTGFRPC